MNFSMLFLKIEKFSEFFIHLSRLFHSVTVDGKYEFLEKSISSAELRDVVDVSRSMCTPKGGDIME